MLLVRGGRTLIAEGWRTADVGVTTRDGQAGITLSPGAENVGLTIDARGLLVVPGLVDIHGDAFERQIMPRPGVTFDLRTALAETDRQLAANGITTAFHGLTWSWEPGFRGADAARAFLAAVEQMQPRLSVDTRVHLRQETFNLDAEDEIVEWLGTQRVSLLAFNDHMTGTITTRYRPDKMADMVRRSGLEAAEFQRLVDRVVGRARDVPASIVRLAKAAALARIPMLSHDDLTPDARAHFRALGAGIAEFPVTAEVARAAVAAGDVTVFGAPNVLRGGSHTGCPGAADMVLAGCCSVLASDYYYPALLQAPFVLARSHGADLAAAWSLVSTAPAQAAGLHDRGQIAEGRRADMLVVDFRDGAPPAVVATIANGRLVHLADASRLVRA